MYIIFMISWYYALTYEYHILMFLKGKCHSAYLLAFLMCCSIIVSQYGKEHLIRNASLITLRNFRMVIRFREIHCGSLRWLLAVLELLTLLALVKQVYDSNGSKN